MDVNLTAVNNNLNEEITVKKQLMILLYAGENDGTLVKSLKKDLQRTLPSSIQTEIVYNSTKLFSLLNNSKDVTALEDKHDVAYRSVCATGNCNANYIAECARRLNERVKDHNGRDRNSYMVKHTIECGHEPVSKDNFKIIANGFVNKTYKRKINEALMIKRFKPFLNIQKKSFKLQLFN